MISGVTEHCDCVDRPYIYTTGRAKSQVRMKQTIVYFRPMSASTVLLKKPKKLLIPHLILYDFVFVRQFHPFSAIPETRWPYH